MSASKIIKQIMIERDISVKTLSEMIGIKPQLLSNKLYRDSFTYNDYIKIVNILGCTVQTVINDTKKVFINSYSSNEIKLQPTAISNNTLISKEITPLFNKEHKKQYNPFTEDDIKQLDLQKLLSNIPYQMEIAETFGMEILAALLDKARQQEAEKTETESPK